MAEISLRNRVSRRLAQRGVAGCCSLVFALAASYTTLAGAAPKAPPGPPAAPQAAPAKAAPSPGAKPAKQPAARAVKPAAAPSSEHAPGPPAWLKALGAKRTDGPVQKVDTAPPPPTSKPGDASSRYVANLRRQIAWLNNRGDTRAAEGVEHQLETHLSKVEEIAKLRSSSAWLVDHFDPHNQAAGYTAEANRLEKALDAEVTPHLQAHQSKVERIASLRTQSGWLVDHFDPHGHATALSQEADALERTLYADVSAPHGAPPALASGAALRELGVSGQAGAGATPPAAARPRASTP